MKLKKTDYIEILQRRLFYTLLPGMTRVTGASGVQWACGACPATQTTSERSASGSGCSWCLPPSQRAPSGLGPSPPPSPPPSSSSSAASRCSSRRATPDTAARRSTWRTRPLPPPSSPCQLPCTPHCPGVLNAVHSASFPFITSWTELIQRVHPSGENDNHSKPYLIKSNIPI